MAENVVLSVFDGDEKICPSSEEKVFTTEFIKTINQELKFKLSLTGVAADIKSGFKLKGKNHETIVDRQAVKEYLREKEEDNIAAELFL